jgi:hypothetical protein
MMLANLNAALELGKTALKAYILSQTCEPGWVAFAYSL